jgi:hypothetical protein
VNILNKQHIQPTGGGPAAWVLDKVLTTAHHKNLPRYKTFHKALDLE